jgi:hypothetical protein
VPEYRWFTLLSPRTRLQWEEKNPPRDPTTGELRADFIRFPHGMAALGSYIHAKGLSFAIYSAESSTTCGGYPASANHEALDASTFASWGVGRSTGHVRCGDNVNCIVLTHVVLGRADYIKVDGCGDNAYYPTGYAAMGAALEATGREIVYSCSWPAYIGDNESVKPFGTFIMDGCNLWRNWCVGSRRVREICDNSAR